MKKKFFSAAVGCLALLSLFSCEQEQITPAANAQKSSQLAKLPEPESACFDDDSMTPGKIQTLKIPVQPVSGQTQTNEATAK